MAEDNNKFSPARIRAFLQVAATLNEQPPATTTEHPDQSTWDAIDHIAERARHMLAEAGPLPPGQ